MFAERRQKFLDRIEGAVAVFFAAPESVRNNDVLHDYRQDSNLFYLTGFEEPESVLVVAAHRPEGERTILFCRARDPKLEQWEGLRLGVERAPGTLGLDKALPIEELEARLHGYLEGADRLYFALGREGREADDQMVLRAYATARGRQKRGIRAPGAIIDPASQLGEMRLYKTEAELDLMRQAATLTAEGHCRAMAITRPGLREYQIQVAMEYEWAMRGATRNAYPSIVGSGPNACILHYRAGQRAFLPGELVLVDAGCELDYYACDVTRTWPVDGRFSDPQRAVYEVVLAAQEAAIDQCRVGVPMEKVHEVATRSLVEGMIHLGLLEGEVDECIANESYRRFYMHKTSHWLGIDVHDVGAYYADGTSRALEPGMVLTVEPGIYVSDDDDAAPAHYRGIGVRIEDDVLVTSDKPEVLTAAIPKSVEDIEALVGTAAADLMLAASS